MILLNLTGIINCTNQILISLPANHSMNSQTIFFRAVYLPETIEKVLRKVNSKMNFTASNGQINWPNASHYLKFKVIVTL